MSAGGGAVLTGIERVAVFNRFRAAVGLRFELPLLLDGLELVHRPRTLEVGAGLGWGTLGVVRRLRPSLSVVTDYDASILPATRAYLAREAPGAPVMLARADAKALPFADASFDVVLALYALHHLMGYRPALRELARVTQRGGYFLFVDPLRLAWTRLGRAAPPEGMPTRGEMRGMLRDAGFVVERWRGLPFLPYVRARRA